MSQYFHGEFKTSERPAVSSIHLINHFFDSWPEQTGTLFRSSDANLRAYITREMQWIAKDSGIDQDENIPFVIRDEEGTLVSCHLIEGDGISFSFDFATKTISYDLFTDEPKLLKLMELCGEDITTNAGDQ